MSLEAGKAAADARLSRLLRADAPPENDPMFRIRLIERREQQLYRQRARVRLGVTIALLVLPGVVMAQARPLTAAVVVGMGLMGVGAAMAAIRGARMALQWWRGA